MGGSESIRRLIREFAIERDLLQSDINDSRIIRRMERKLKSGKAVDFTELSGEEAEAFAVFYKYREGDNCDEVKSRIIDRFPDENSYRLYYIVVLTDSYEHKVKVKEWAQSIRNELKRKLKCALSVTSYQALSYYEKSGEKFSIDIGSRIQVLEMPGSGRTLASSNDRAIGRKIKAYTFTANLYDIIGIYNRVGDELFRENVRYGINDQLDVETNIKQTLRENPEDFWFLNNGITITVKKASAFDNRKSDKIVLDCSEPGTVAVINGAQTISTAAEFWFQDIGAKAEPEETQAIRDAAKKRALVLLRVMCVSAEAGDCQTELDKISISLNRQKPIKSEDIAYTSPVIMEINQLYKADEEDELHFRIIKRGESGLGKYQYSLIEFARAVKAYRFRKAGENEDAGWVQQPGEARVSGSNKILKYKAGDASSVYADEIVEEESEAVFRKWYTPVNFVMSALKYYKSAEKRFKKEERAARAGKYDGVILGNGRFYFAAYLVYVCHADHDNKEDFTDFEATDVRLKESFDPLLERYLSMLNKISEEYLAESENLVIDSNTFKSEKLYEKLISYKTHGSDEAVKAEVSELEEDIRAALLSGEYSRED